MQAERPPDHYYLLRTVTHRDKPSGAITILALRNTAKMNADCYPDAVETILRNTCVDDVLHSVDTALEANSMITDMEKILEVRGFKMKHWIISGINHQNNLDSRILNSDSEKILGLVWKPQEDQFSFKVKINFSAVHRGIHTESDLSRTEVGSARKAYHHD